METLLAEAVGTMILVLLGDGVVASVLLARSKGQNSGWIVITIGWGVAVAVAVYAVARISGAHLNPAVTVGLAAIGGFAWADVPGYVVAQTVGAFLGAVLVWLAYLPHWAVTTDKDAKLGVFCTAPAIRSPGANVVTEIIGTAMLVFGILAIGANAPAAPDADANQRLFNLVFAGGLQPLLVGILVLGIGLSLGGSTGYAINPARDFGPRLAHALLPIAGKRDADWGYAWIPIAGPIVGGVVGAILFRAAGF